MYFFLCQAVCVHTLSVKRNLSLLQSDAHIKINQILTQRSYSSPHEAHLKNQRVAFIKKKKNTVKLQRLFFKNHRNCSLRTSYSEHSIAIHSISKAGYVTAVLAIVRVEIHAREVSNFCFFIDLLQFHLISLFLFIYQTFIFWNVLGKEYFS